MVATGVRSRGRAAPLEMSASPACGRLGSYYPGSSGRNRVGAVSSQDVGPVAASANESGEFARVAGRALLESARDIILLVRPDGRIILANAAAERAYGWSRDELGCMNINQLRARHTRDVVPAQIETAIESGILFETEHVRRDGTSFPVEVSSRGLDIAGQPHAISVIRDISARRRRESERDVLLAELEVANRQTEGLLRIVSGAVGQVNTMELLRDTLAVLRDVLRADGTLLFALERDTWVLRAQSGFPRLEAEGFTMSMGEGFASILAEKGEAFWLPNITLTSAHLAVHDDYRIRTMLGVPLYVKGDLYGVVECTWSSERSASEGERVMMQVAADRIMAALTGADLFARAQRSRDIEAALAEASATLASSHRLEEMLPEALGVLARALDCDAAAFGSYCGDCFEVEYGVGVERGPIDVPDHKERVNADVTSPPVVRLGEGDADPAPLRRALGWEEALVTPVRVRGEWVGALLFGRRRPLGGFDERDAEAVRRLSVVLSLAYANSRDYEAEHRIAQTLQESMLTIEARVEDIDFALRYRSSMHGTRVGGDFYDVFPIAGDRVGILIGDVSGKGLDAAVLTALVKQTLRAFAHESVSPAEVVARANAALAGSSRMRDFASVLLVVLHPATGEATYCRAGHPPGLILRGDGRIDATTCGSPVIGALEDMAFEECGFTLAPGDLLVLYTDGVTEARNGEGVFFGDDRVAQVVAALVGSTPEQAASALDSAVMSHTGGRLTDDVAIVTVALP